MTEFIADSERDASDAIAGFVYQVASTIKEWLNLADDELLELERGEDLDRVELQPGKEPGGRLLQQFKKRSSSLTLRSPDALEALARFVNTARKTLVFV